MPSVAEVDDHCVRCRRQNCAVPVFVQRELDDFHLQWDDFAYVCCSYCPECHIAQKSDQYGQAKYMVDMHAKLKTDLDNMHLIYDKKLEGSELVTKETEVFMECHNLWIQPIDMFARFNDVAEEIDGAAQYNLLIPIDFVIRRKGELSTHVDVETETGIWHRQIRREQTKPQYRQLLSEINHNYPKY